MNNERISKVTLCKKKENLILLFMSTVKIIVLKIQILTLVPTATKNPAFFKNKILFAKNKIPGFEPLTFGILAQAIIINMLF